MTQQNVTVTQVANTGTGHVAYLESENHQVQLSYAYPRTDEGDLFTEGQVYSVTLELAADAPEPAPEPVTAEPGTATV